ncbi:GAF domain-containing protein [Geosporobacter subterraneus DSM 17957]|uniref:GAF domain-containing protein n=1 Tax=Geosporobacter subterraneus DSM 17957 TaxID=1121919 RepID=A0A1M6P698_9FIRM|nr:GAF domain-containing protein [Geosporobacter subterraneus]SHK03433.1 GAF domain-containing protein [Geosporobacter subterraneus DSM 17957]
MSKRQLLPFSVILICTIAMLLFLYLLLPFFGYTVKRLHPAVIILLVVLPLWLNHHYHSKHLRKLNHQLSSMDMLMRVNRELARSNLLNKAMLEISNSIVRIQNLDELLQQVLEKAVNIIDSADKGSIMISNREGKLNFRAVYGYDMASLSKITLSLEETFIYTHTKGASLKACIIQNPQAFNNQNMSENNLNKFEDAKALDIRATICAPIVVDEELYGLILNYS